MKPSYLAQAGFTLVEATIVLVVIGLLLGTVLWGQELLVNGRSKMVIIQLNELSAAVEVYRDRYQAIPGDDAMAQGRWNWTAVPAAAPSSPGNGIVDGAYNQATAVPEPESRLFWWHLRQAGFLAGPTDPANASQSAQQPTNALGGMTGATMGTGAGTVGLAVAVDIRLDDGASAAGMVRAQRQTVPNENIGTAAASYVEDGGSYLVCRKLL
jgi:type II secretory pathway pseudopilin PulG